MMYKTNVYTWVLLYNPPFLQKLQISSSKNLNWRTIDEIGKKSRFCCLMVRAIARMCVDQFG